MKPRTTIVLVVLLLICGGYIVIRHTDVFKPPEPLAPDKHVLSPPPGEAKELTIVARDGGRTVFARRGDAWQIIEPIQARADSFEVSGLIGTLSDLEYIRIIDEDDKDADPALTGLAEPRWTLKLVDEEGTAHTIDVGRSDPTKVRETYVRGGKDNRIYEVAVDLASKLDRPLRDFRDKDIFDLKTIDVVRLSVEGGQRPFQLAKSGQDWGLVKPVSAKADKARVEKLLNRLLYLRVGEFVEDRPERLSDFDLDDPRLIARVWVKGPEPATTAPTTATAPAEPRQYALALGRPTGQNVYAKLLDQPAVFTVPASLEEDLQPELVALRDKQVLQFKTEDVLRVELELPGGKAALVNQDGRWSMEEPFAGPANADEVAALLRKMGSLQAENFEDDVDEVALAGFGLDLPRGKATLHLSGTTETVSLLIGSNSPSGEMAFVKPAASSSVIVLRSAEVARLLSPPATYWDATLLAPGEDARCVKILVKRKDGAFLLEREADEWSLVQPLKAPADIDRVNEVLDHLEKLTATKIVALGKEVPEAYRKPDEEITVGLTVRREPSSQPTTASTQAAAATAAATRPAPTTETYVLHVVKVLGNVYAWVDASDRQAVAVGECAQSLFEDLAAELRDRTVLAIDPDQVRRIKIAADKDTFELAKEPVAAGDEWRSVADPYVKIDSQKVASFLKDIRRLEAERFVSHKSSESAKFGLAQPWMALELTFTKGDAVRITVSPRGQRSKHNRYAIATDVEGVFVLSGDAAKKMAKKLQDFKK